MVPAKQMCLACGRPIDELATTTCIIDLRLSHVASFGKRLTDSVCVLTFLLTQWSIVLLRV